MVAMGGTLQPMSFAALLRSSIVTTMNILQISSIL
jgi:hypothetical protein